MSTSVLDSRPDRIERPGVTVMEQVAVDELDAMQAVWPSFERLVGLRGRKMYARIDERLGTCTVCTPLKPDDEPARLACPSARCGCRSTGDSGSSSPPYRQP